MKMAIKITAILLILTILPISLISCDRKYDEEEVRAAARTLISESQLLNEIYYGEGIKYLNYSDRNNGVYCEADPAHLLELGFNSLSELKTKTKEVFSKDHAERMFKGSFTGTFTQNGSSSMARYCQIYDKEGMPDYLMVYSEYEDMLLGDATYDLDSIAVLGSKGDIVYVTVEVRIVYNDKAQNITKTQDTTLKIGLFEEAAGWRLASPTYASYNEYKDIYDELQKG